VELHLFSGDGIDGLGDRLVGEVEEEGEVDEERLTEALRVVTLEEAQDLYVNA